MIRNSWMCGLALLLAALPTGAEEAVKKVRPNVVLILADDQGWGSTSVAMDGRVPASASDFMRTPNLAKLAARGVRFSSGYAPHANCSPSRYAIQTGKSPAKLRMTDIVGRKTGKHYEGNRLVPPRSVDAIDRAEVTIAEWIRKHRPGYATAHFGKWHLAGGGPSKHGYDAGDGETGNPDGNRGVEGDPKRIFSVTRRSNEWMAAQAAAGKPFFLQVSHYATHLRVEHLATTRAATGKRPLGKRHTQAGFAAMTEDLDAGVGRLLAKIRELGIEDRTYVIYLADNGTYPLPGPGNLNGPLHGWKATIWEGGVRVPFVVAGPGIEPGQSDERVVGYDLFPTIGEWLGIEGLPPGVEGGSLVPALLRKGRVKRPKDFLVFHWPHYQVNKGSHPASTIYRGRHKLHLFWETGEMRLYDLEADRAETKDLAARMPKLAAELEKSLRAHLVEIGAAMPTVNAAYSAAEDPARRYAEIKRRLMTEPWPGDLLREKSGGRKGRGK